MRKYTWLIGLFALLAWACGDNDDDFKPFGGERNWLVVEDSDDPIDAQRYRIFRNTGVPVYYNDTIGSEMRYTLATGEPYTYYEVLQVFYSPGSVTPGKLQANYTLVRDRDKVKPVLDFLETDALPRVPESVYVPSILLVDSLKTPSGDTIAYKGLNTIVLSKVKDFDKVDQKLYRGVFLATLVANTLAISDGEWLEDYFYAITYRVNPGNKSKMYSTGTTSVGTYVYTAYSGLTVPAAEQTLGGLGFVGTYTKPTGTSERMWQVPSKSQDVRQYCIEIFASTEAEFIAKHGQYPVVMEKYEVMKRKLETYGFTFE
ncbi:hypothetical protein [Butyricimonas sp.]|uniref:hypothetical protein n=1 Tax=Butyricimonas sp. TaxID=1969738 RepID=UPI0025BD5877|nr:hypothetical protein [Butyricimonas sp.]